jgi:hypothetical protein
MLYNEKTTEKTIRTTTFDRAYRVVIEHPNKGAPSIRYEEERIERKDGKDRSLGRLGYVEETLTSANVQEKFNVINAEGEVLAEASFQQVQALLYSLYFHLANKRDQRRAP